MAYSDEMRQKINQVYGVKKKRIERVEIRQGNTIIKTLYSPAEHESFFGNKDNADLIRNSSHHVFVTPSTDGGYTIDSVKGTTKGYASLIGKQMHRTNISVKHAGGSKRQLGDTLSKEKTPRVKLMEDLRGNKRDILKTIPDKSLIQITKRRNGARYLELLEKNGLGEYNSDHDKANAVRDFVADRGLQTSHKSIEGFAASVVWDAGKETGHVKRETVRGTGAYDHINKELNKNRTSHESFLRLQKRHVAKIYGGKGAPSRKVFDEVKDRKGFRTDVETMKHIQSQEGREEYKNYLRESVINNTMRQSSANKIIDNLKLGNHIEVAPEDIGSANRTRTNQRLAVSHILGFTGKSPPSDAKVVDFLRDKLKDDTNSYNSLLTGSNEEIRSHFPKSVSYNELSSYYGEEPPNSQLKKLKRTGVEITGLPPHVEKKLAGVKEEPSGRGRDRPSGSSSRSYGGSSRSKKSYREEGDLIGRETIRWKDGEPIVVKERGRISSALHDTKTKIPGLRSKEEKERRKKEIYREKDRARKNEYERMKDDPSLDYLTKEEKKYVAYDANAVEKKMMLDKARRLYRDPAYRARIGAKKEEKKGIYEAKLLKTKRESKRRAKAATSPFWNLWYTLTHNMMVLTGVFLLIALLFLPIGIFHVTGWLIAAGFISLIMFIVWVFIELWFLISQALVSIINMIGQAIIGAINAVGFAIANAFGQPFTPFQHTLVQNMNLVGIDPVTGQKTILGITWSQWNLVPPSFLRLDEFMPRTFDTDVLIAKIWPGIHGFFDWYTQPLATRYTDFIATAEWHEIATVLGIPIALIIIGIVASVLYVKRRLY